jgi:hypothetical protein
MEKRISDKTSPSDAPVWFSIPNEHVASPEDQAKRDARDVADQFKEDMAAHIQRAKLRA